MVVQFEYQIEIVFSPPVGHDITEVSSDQTRESITVLMTDEIRFSGLSSNTIQNSSP